MVRLVSVIVPVYNAEKYLDRCINSIIKQTYENIELLLIDDGSTDQSSEICIAWKNKDSRVRFFHQENAGVSSARNLGLTNATGDYITFVDADDYIELDFCEKMVAVIQQSNAEIVFCEHRKIFEDGTRRFTGSNSNSIKTISRIEFEYYGSKERRVVWGAIYLASLLKELKFSTGIAIGEDALFLANAIQKADKITYYDTILYNYRIQNESAYYGSFSVRKYTEIDAWLKICEVFERRSITRLSAEALCADTAIIMLVRYTGDIGFEGKYINRLIHVYRRKLPLLIQYDFWKKRNSFKHILYGLLPHIFVKYWGWKNEKKRRNCNTV